MLAILVALTTGCQNDNDTSAPAARDTLFSLNVESNLQDINSITGLWESNKIDSSSQGDYEYVLRIKFDSNNATKAVKCTRKSTGAMAVVQHTVPYKIENGKVTTPIKGATIIGNGPDVLTRVSMVGNDMELDSGIGTCGKDGQSVPVGVGQPTIRIDDLTVGGTST